MPVAKEEIQRRMARFERVCRQHGLKVTHQRTQIFRELAATGDHPDVETLYKRVHRRVPAVSLDTVYRTLALLEEKGLVRRAELQSGPARYDANTEPHHHFVCSVCGLVRDVYSREMDNLAVPRSVQRIGTVVSSHVQLRGLCARCAQGRHRGE
jgi:Fur family peroxide stress response transcriptional regulator